MKLTTKLTITFAFAAALLGVAYSQATKSTTPPQSVSAGEGGRYQIVLNASAARYTFLLDTQTGRVWQLTQFTDLEDDPTAWLIQTRLDSQQEMREFARTHTPKKQP